MPTLILDQSSIPGTPFDGSKDGELFIKTWGTPNKAINVPSTGVVGFDFSFTNFNEVFLCLRFKLPDSLFSPDVTITKAKLKLYLDYDPGRSFEPVEDANIGENNLFFGIVFFAAPALDNAPTITNVDTVNHYYRTLWYLPQHEIELQNTATDRIELSDSSWLIDNDGLSRVQVDLIPDSIRELWPFEPQDEYMGSVLENWKNGVVGISGTARIIGFSIFFEKIISYLTEQRRATFLTYSKIEHLIANGEPTSLRAYYPQLEIEYTGSAGLEQFISDPVVIEQDITYVPELKQTLTIEQDITFSLTSTRDYTDAIVFDQDIAFFGPRLASYADDIAIDQSVTVTKVHSGSIEDELVLDQEIEARGPLFVSVEQSVDVEQDVNGYLPRTHTESIEDVLLITDSYTYSGVLYQSVEQFLLIQQTITVAKTVELTIEDVLILDQDVTWTMPLTGQVINDITIEQDINIFGVHNLSVEDELTFDETITGFLDQDVECSVESESTVTFEYLTNTLVLPAPDFGDRVVVNKQRINRQVTSGDQIVFADENWESDRTLRLSFSALTEEQVIEYQDFVEASIGHPIQYTDHFGTVHNCIMRSPTADIVIQKEPCSYTIQIELELI